MERFDRTGEDRALHCECRLMRPGVIWISAILIASVIGLLRPKVLVAQERGTMAVLPLRVHAPEPLAHLERDLQETLSLCLGKRGFRLINPEVINTHPLALKPVFEMKDLLRIGKDLEVDWIVTGSLTQIGKGASLDLKVVDVTGEVKPFFIFMAADDIDDLADTAKRSAVSIDHQIIGVAQVDSVRVSGNQRVENEAILVVVRTKKGDDLDYERLDKDLRDIYKMGFFKDVTIETKDGPKGKIVTFIVTEKPSIGRIVFEGNKKVKKDELKEELGIKLYSILDHNEIKQSINRLRDFYRQKGYYNVDIKETVEPIPNNEVLLKYEIAEHEKVYITKIEFVGNTRFDDDDLKDIMETSEKGFFSWITKSGYLDKKKLEFDAYKITSFYHNNGFIKAKVGEPKISYEKVKGLTITIEIDEGLQYDVNSVAIEGDLIKSIDELMEEIQISKEEVYNREIVRNDIIALRNIYADEGYAYAEVTTATKKDDENHLVDITYNISKGQKVRFEKINITGNRKTRDKVVRRELKVIEGEYYSGKDLKRSSQNLHRLGFFEEVEIQTKKGSTEDLMILDVKVKERPTGSFSIGAGYSSEDKVFGMAQVSQRNLFGYGQEIQLSAKLGGETNEVDLSFLEPWLFDIPLAAGVSLYKLENEYDEYTKDSLGGRLKFGFPLHVDEYTTGSVKYTYDDADITDISEDAAYEIKDMEGRNLTSSMEFAIKRNSKDRFWNPTKGSVNSVSFEYAGGILGGDVYFNKYEAKSGWYFPFYWETVFFTQGKWGYIDQRSGGKLPVYQKYRLGGINSVRGFDYASISPVDPDTGDRIGGEKMMVYNLEYRFPLIKEQGVVGLVFFDAGNVFTKDESYTFSGIRRSAGAGIRWYSPMGPIRLEWGYNLDQKPGEASNNWEFSIGGTF